MYMYRIKVPNTMYMYMYIDPLSNYSVRTCKQLKLYIINDTKHSIHYTNLADSMMYMFIHYVTISM